MRHTKGDKAESRDKEGSVALMGLAEQSQQSPQGQRHDKVCIDTVIT